MSKIIGYVDVCPGDEEGETLITIHINGDGADPGGSMTGTVPSDKAHRLRAFFEHGEEALETALDVLHGTPTMRREAEALGLDKEAIYAIKKALGK